MPGDLTKLPLPLIIMLVFCLSPSPGEGGATGTASAEVGRASMRIHVYKDPEGNLSVLVEPSVGKGKPPVLLHDITAETVAERVLPVVETMRLPKTARDKG